MRKHKKWLDQVMSGDLMIEDELDLDTRSYVGSIQGELTDKQG
ncbi:hypothetical protein [Gracilibacillus orientalis]|nr:hypothetical protein [Gracilibacillus orientalis]